MALLTLQKNRRVGNANLKEGTTSGTGHLLIAEVVRETCNRLYMYPLLNSLAQKIGCINVVACKVARTIGCPDH